MGPSSIGAAQVRCPDEEEGCCICYENRARSRIDLFNARHKEVEGCSREFCDTRH